jgi:DNA-binding MarR family transcriptional regulator
MASSAKSISPDQAAALKRSYNSLKPFRNLRETMPLQYVTVFLLVASDEHHNFKTYAERIGTSESLMSRHIADLGEVNRYHTAGFGLLESYDDVRDRRNKLIRLTAKGRGIVWEMFQALEKKA